MEKLKHLYKYHNITLFGCQIFFSSFGLYKKKFPNGLSYIYDWQMAIGWLYINRWKNGIEP